VKIKLDENLGERGAACAVLIGGMRGSSLTGKLWIVHHGRIREYRPDRIEEDPD
jgi:hypothetical protein